MTFHVFVNNVQQWASDRGIFAHSTAIAQAFKTGSEAGELLDAFIKNDNQGIKDAIGDITVCLVNFCYFVNYDIANKRIGLIEFSNGPKKECLENTFASTSWLITAITRNSKSNIKYSIDFAIELLITSLQNTAHAFDLDFLECCEHAWEQIKNRRGHMVAGGAFVKE